MAALAAAPEPVVVERAQIEEREQEGDEEEGDGSREQVRADLQHPRLDLRRLDRNGDGAHAGAAAAAGSSRATGSAPSTP